MRISFGQNNKTNNNLPAKLNWQDIPTYNPQCKPKKIINNLKLENRILGDVFITSSKPDSFNNYIITVIKNKWGKKLGEELYSINPERKNINGINLTVKDEYRQRNFRLGEKLRLITVIEMLENNCENITITSKDTAIYFHSKYKFVPCNTEFTRMNTLIQDISNDKTPEFSELAKEAREINEQIIENNENPEALRKLVRKTNDLTRRYIEKALEYPNPQKNHPLNTFIDMILTKENVIKNKNYFNKLFQNNGIEYEIKDPQ